MVFTRVTLFFALLIPAVGLAEEVELNVISWNLQSGHSEAAYIAKQVAEKGEIDLWGFNELENQAFLDTIRQEVSSATGHNYQGVISSNSGSDGSSLTN